MTDFHLNRFCFYRGPPLNASIVSETMMSQFRGCKATGSRATEIDTSPGNLLPAKGRYLAGEVLTPAEVCVATDYDDQFDVTVSLQSLLGLP